MRKFLITFMSSGGLTVEAETEAQAREIFSSEMQDAAADEMKSNGIDVTEVSEVEDD